jgi:hypothetical protein
MALTEDPTHHLDADDFDLDKRPETSIECEYCQSNIRFSEEAVLITVKQSFINGSGVVTTIEVLTGEGEYEYAPTFLHGACWAEIFEQMSDYVDWIPDDAIEDRIARQDIHPSRIVFRCDTCGDVIDSYERYAHAMVGTFIVERLDEAEFEPDPMRDPMILCMHCMNVVDTNCLERWDEDDNDREEEEDETS